MKKTYWLWIRSIDYEQELRLRHKEDKYVGTITFRKCRDHSTLGMAALIECSDEADAVLIGHEYESAPY